MNKKQFGSFLCFAILSFSTISFAEEKNNTKFIDKYEISEFHIITGTNLYKVYKSEEKGIIDKKGKIIIKDNDKISIIKPLFSNKSPNGEEYTSNLLIYQNKKNKSNEYGVINNKGEVILESKYQNIGYGFLYNFFDFKLKNKYGVINIDGKIILEPKYQKVAINFPNEVNKDVIDFKINDKYGVIDKNGKILLKPEYDELGNLFKNSNSNYFYVKKQSKYYILDKRDFSIKRELDDIYFSKKTDFDPENNDYQKDPPIINEPIYKNTALIKENNLWGIINDNNEFILKPYFDEIVFFDNFSSDKIKDKSKKLGLVSINSSENVQILENRDYEAIGYQGYFDEFYHNYFNNEKKIETIPFKKNGKWGFISEKGEIILEPKWDYTYAYLDDLAYVAIKSKDLPIKTFINKYEQVAFFKEQGYKFGVVNNEGKTIVKPEFDFIKRFSEGLAYAIKGNKAGFIDKNGNWAIEPQFYSNISDHSGLNNEFNYFFNGFATVSKDNKLLLIDKFGKTHIKFSNDWNIHYMTGINFSDFFEKKKKEKNIDLNNISNIEFLSASGFYDGICIVLLKNGKYGIVNTDGKWVLKPEFDFIHFNDFIYKNQEKNIYLHVSKNKKDGLLDTKGNWILKPEFKSIPFISKEEKDKNSLFQIIDKNNKIGFIDENYNMIIEPRFYSSEVIIKDIGVVYTEYNKARLMDLKGNFISNKTFDKIERSSNDTFNVQVGDLWGIIDKNANFIIEPKFRSIGEFKDNYTDFSIGLKIGICDKKGNLLLPANYDEIDVFFHNPNLYLDENNKIYTKNLNILLKKDNKYELRNSELNIIFDNIEDIQNNFIKLNNKWYIIDGNFNKKPLIYEQIQKNNDYSSAPKISSSGIAIELLNKYNLVKFKNKAGIIDNKANIILKPIFEDLETYKKNELTKAKLNGKWGFINDKGEFIIKPKFDSISNFYNNVAEVKINDKFGYIDKNGKLLLNIEFDEIESRNVRVQSNAQTTYESNYYISTTENKKGLFNSNFKQILEQKYDYITNLYDTKFFIVTSEDEKKGIFDLEKEKFVLEPIFDSLSIINNEIVKFTKNDKFGFANLSGDILLSETCENIKNEKSLSTTMDSYIFPCKINNKYGYIDEKGNKLIDFKYDSASFFRNNEAIVEIGNNRFTIDKKGNVIE